MVSNSMTKEARIHKRENTASSVNDVGKLKSCMQNNQIKLLSPYAKINSKWIRLKCMTWNHKMPRRRNTALHSLTYALAIFFWIFLFRQGKKSKNKQIRLHQSKKLLHTKMKRQLTEKEKIFVKDIFKKGLIPKIYKNSYNSISSKQTTPILKNQPNF